MGANDAGYECYCFDDVDVCPDNAGLMQHLGNRQINDPITSVLFKYHNTTCRRILMSNDVIDDTDPANNKLEYLVTLFNNVYKKVDWSKVSREVKTEISWLNYASRLTDVFTKDTGQWTIEFVTAKIKRLLNEQQVEYRPQLGGYLFCLLAYLHPDKVRKKHDCTGHAYLEMRP